MNKRRIEDQDLNLLLARSAASAAEPYLPVDPASCTIEITGVRLDPSSGAALDPIPEPRSEPEETVFILDLGENDAMLVAGAAVRRIPRGDGGRELIGRAAVGAAAWRRERLRIWKRALLPEQLISFSEQLTRAETPAEVCRALVEHTARIVGGFTAVVFIRGEGDDTFRPFEGTHSGLDGGELAIPALPRMSRPGVITAKDARADTGGPFGRVEPLFRELSASVVAHVPFGDDGVLALIERRDDRLFEPDDWDLMGTLSRQAGAALQRVHLFQEVRSLSLADPLTGLANRRHMKVVLERGLAAARRGDGLAVVMFDLDDFKAINDEHGHLVGDRLLVTVADVLRKEARGADLVVRYGGDEFLVVLPGGNVQGATTFVRRVRDRLADQVELSAGIAEYAPNIVTVDQLIEVADRHLYVAKQNRRQQKGEA